MPFTADGSRPLRMQRGTTLLEALIAFLVLSIGILTVGRMQSHLRLGSDIARQRSEAVRLGQEELESLRGFAIAAASAGLRSYADIASAAATIDAAAGYATHTRYRLQREVEPSDDDGSKSMTVTVGWDDRSGQAQRVVLHSIIVGHDPAYSAALALAPALAPVHGAFNRSAWIPLFAKNLGNGKSAFKPVAGGSLAFVLDNRTGLVEGACIGVDPAVATWTLTPADLLGCTAGSAYLVSGTVRFSSATPPSAALANDPPLELAVALTLTGGTYPRSPTCTSQAVKSVLTTIGGVQRVQDVPIDATPAFLGVASWSETGDRHVAYHCLVYPLANGRWSGHTAIVPVGWTIGLGPLDRRICRYASDLDGSGAVDTNVEHPADYVNVSTPLPQQNFLVVNGSQACPVGSPVRITGTVDDVFVDAGTQPHQP